MLELDLDGLGLGGRQLLGVTEESGPDRTALRLDGIDPDVGRLFFISLPNPDPWTTWEYNQVIGMGANVLANGNPRDANVAAPSWVAEGSWEDGDPGGQSELYCQIKYQGLVRRPFYARYFLSSDQIDVQVRGKSSFTQEDTTGALLTINPRADTRRVSLADDGEIATSGGTNVQVRGVRITGSKKIDTNTGNPVQIAGVEIVDGKAFKPRLVSQAGQPTPATGELLVWHDTDDDSIRIVFNHSVAGVVSVLMS